jgi:hypothetical protein
VVFLGSGWIPRLPKSFQRLENFLDLLKAGFTAFAEMSGQGGWIGAGDGEFVL